MQTNIYKLTYLFCTLICGLTATAQQTHQKIVIKTNTLDSIIKQADSLSKNKAYIQAELAYTKAYELAKKTNSIDHVHSIGFKTVEFYEQYAVKDYITAIWVLNDLIMYSSKTGDDKEVFKALLELGYIYSRLGKYVKALTYYNKVLEYLEYCDYPDLYRMAYNHRGQLFGTIGDTERAKKDSKKSLIYIPKDDTTKIRIAYLNISAAFSDSEPDSIQHYSKITTQYCHKKPINRICIMAYNNIAWSYYLKKKNKEALEIIHNNINLDSISYYQRDDDLYPTLMHTLGSIQYGLKQYNKALDYFLTAHRYFVDKKDVSSLILTKEDLSKTYEKLGKLEQSLKILREIKPLQLEQLKIKVNKELAKNIVRSKEVIISNLEQTNLKIKKKVSDIRFFSYLSGSLLFVILIILLCRNYKNKLKYYEVNQKLMLLRLTSLRSSMNPHFLFNTFSTLQNFILKNESKKANEYMTDLSSLIRDVLNGSDSVCIDFNDELDIIKSYVKLQRGRFEEKFDVVYDIDQQIIEDNPKIPAMIIQPFIENAIIHGFSKLSEKGKLKIKVVKNKKTILCRIIDNGVGRKATTSHSKQNKSLTHLSMATKNTNERLEILSKILKSHPSIHIKDLFCKHKRPKGTEVIINLPTIKDIYNDGTNPEMFHNR
ncbi:histidine kinase [Aquimarina longa]|uniref:histidine kinase n=1 Tax=Aquimarina longa TaxID=1080221 RepID=UPI00078149E9|nr:histidine kinase [Aquimarina longa]